MRVIAGQVAGHTGRLLHRLLQLALALVVLAGVGLAILSWRLSRGPLELTWLAHRMEDAANADGGPTRLSIGNVTLAWNGFTRGVDHPLELEVTDVAAVDPKGVQVASIPHAGVTLSPGAALFGRIAPRTITIDGARLRLLRAQDGSVRLDLGSLDEGAEASLSADDMQPSPGGQSPSLSAFLAELTAPPQGDARPGSFSPWSQLRSIRIRDAAATVVDRQLRQTWSLPHITVDLARSARGGIEGSADVTGDLAGERLHANLQAHAEPGGRATELQVKLDEVVPARLASATPMLGGLGAVRLPVSLTATARLGADLVPTSLHLDAALGRGAIGMGAGELPVMGAALRADGTLDVLDVRLDRLELAPPRSGKPVTTVKGHAEIRRQPELVRVAATLDVDALAFADLPDIWPVGVGGKGTRPWLAENITDGVARNGHVEMVLQAPRDFSSVDLTSLSGGLEGHDITVHWLRPVPPVEHGEARLSFRGPDVIEIALLSGREAGGSQGGITARNGLMRIIGLTVKDQVADIDADLAGPMADALAVLKHPRLNLLSKHPIELRDPSGQVSGHLSIVRLPLEFKISLDDFRIGATAKLTDVHLGGVAGGRDLDHASGSLDVNNDMLKVVGQGEVSKVPGQFQVDMDFRDGPASQVVQKVSASAELDQKQWQALGLDAGDTLGGSASVVADIVSRRDSRGDITVKADLTRASITPPRLNWAKPAGLAATADIHLLLDHDRLTGIDRVRLQGEGIDVAGQVDLVGGAPVSLRLQRAVLGQALDAHGDIRWPAGPGAPWVVGVAGRLLDLTAPPRTGEPKPPPARDAPGTPYRVDAQFDRVVFGPDRALTGVALQAENDGRIFRTASLAGKAGGPFDASISGAPGHRLLSGRAADVGSLLRAVDLYDYIRGGRLTLSGSFDDSTPAHLLSGSAEMHNFSLVRAPAMAKILQAMTLYGLVDAVQGGGLGFDEMVAPLQYSRDVLTLGDARVFSSSLGMTTKGRVDTVRSTCDLDGTIVPAYFFNNLLGRIPLVGRLFSPEKGGGLFAATYSVRGSCDDPSVSVNPLAAVTPGFLRGLFGMFDEPASGTPRTPPPLSQGSGGGKN